MERTLVVVTGPAGRTFAVHELRGERPGAEIYTVEDVAERCVLGQLQGDVTPFLVDIAGIPHVLFAGTVEPAHEADRVQIVSPADTPEDAFTQDCRVRHGVWITFPERFREGMKLEATWYRGEQAAYSCESGPLRSDALEPIFGPGWTSYAPLG